MEDGSGAARPALGTGTSKPASPYASSAYLESCSHLGEPVEVRGTRWLRRPIDESGSDFDLCGAYPLWTCDAPAELPDAFEALAPQGVCAVAVVDPLLAQAQGATLARAFSELWMPFKRHYLVDLRADFEGARSKHHRQAVRRAAKRVSIERAADPMAHAEEWVSLYGHLRERLGFHGAPADFSDRDLAAQLALPGATYWRALVEGDCVAASVWLESAGVTAYHLSAASPAARSTEAPYGLMDAALREAAERGLETATLGGAAGLEDDPSDGLAYFKSGWSTDQAPAFLGGRVLQPERYAELCAGRETSTFFPAYRA